MPQQTSNRQFWTACLVVCLIAFGLRLPHLQSHSFWMDETYSAWFSSMSLHDLWTDVPLYETHPPMYYSILKGWRAVAGASEAGLRSLSVMASIATVFVLASAGRVLRAGKVGDQIALLAALFLAVNTGSIIYAQQARPYAIETLMATLAILASFRLLELVRAQAALSQASNLSAAIHALLPAMAALALATGATLWMHNTAIIIAFGIWSGLILSLLVFAPQRRTMQLIAIALPGLGALLIWSPFLPMFIAQNHGMAGMTYWMSFHPKDGMAAWHLIAGEYLWMNPIMLLLLLGLWQLWRANRPSMLHALTILTLPLGFILAYSYLRQPVFVDRLFEWMAPLVMAIAAAGLVLTLRKTSWRAAATFVTLGFCLLGTAKLYQSTPNEDWQGWLNHLASNAKQGDIVVLVQNEIEMPLRYYTDKNFPKVLSLPATFPARDLPQRHYIGNPGAPGIVESDKALVRAATVGHHRVWLIHRGQQLYDPSGMIHTEVSSGRKLIEKFGTPNVTFELFE